MPFDTVLKFKPTLNNSDEALNAIIQDDENRKNDFTQSITSFINSAINANPHIENSKTYMIRAMETTEDLMHELTMEYVIGIIPKEYYIGMISNLNKLLDMIAKFDPKNPNQEFGYNKWEQDWPKLFVESEEGDYDKQKTAMIRRMGGLRIHLNPLTEDMLELLPQGTQNAYKKGFVVEDKDKKKDENNNVIDDDLLFGFNGNYDYKYGLKNKYRLINDNEMSALDEKTDFNRTKNAIDEFVNDSTDDLNTKLNKNADEKKEFDTVLSNIHFSTQAKDEIISLYMLWAMAEKNMSFEDASKVFEDNGPAQEDVDAFKKFCKDNQILNQNDTENKFSEKIKNWSDFIVKAMNKIKGFQIPDIDYSDKNAVTDKYKEFFLLAKMGSVVCDKLIGVMLNRDNRTELSAQSVAIKAMGGEKEFMKNIRFWSTMRNMTKHFTNSFYRDDIKDVLAEEESLEDKKEALNKEFNDRQVEFHRFGQIMDKQKGKTIGEATDSLSLEFRAGEKAYNDILWTQSKTIPDNEVFDYAEGINKQAYTDKMNAFYQEELSKDNKHIAHELPMKSYEIVTNPKHSKEQANAILSSPVSAEGTIKFLKKKDAKGKLYSEYINEFFGRYYTDVSVDSLLDINKTISDLFLIDGKTPEELWGEKYKNVQDAADKELYYRTEIYRAILHQEKDIKVRVYELENNKLKETQTVTLLPNKDKLENLLNSYEMYKEVAGDLLAKLSAYYNHLEENQENNAEYQNMHDSLKRVVDTIGKLDKKSNVKLTDAFENLKQFKDAFIAYCRKVEADGPDAFRANLDTDSVPDEYDLTDTVDVMSELVKDMSAEIFTGETNNISTSEPTPKILYITKNNYERFTCQYHESKLMNPNEIKEKVRELKEDIKNKKQFADVRTRVINNQALTPEEMIIFNSSVRYYNTNAYLSQLKTEIGQKLVLPQNNPNEQRYREAFRKVPFACDRSDSMTGVFIIWNMGHKGMSFKEALDLLKSDKAQASIEEFVTFCENNSVQGNPNPVKGKESALAWAEIMKNATERMKDYSLSDLDLNDNKSVEKHLEEMSMIRNISINFVQEFVKRIGSANIPAGVDANGTVYGLKNGEEYLSDALGGKDNLLRMQQYWVNLQSPFGFMDNAFNDFNDEVLTQWENGNISQALPYLISFTTNEVYGRMALKRLKENGLNSTKPLDYYRENSILPKIQALFNDLRMGTVTVPMETVINYITGQNRKPFEDFITSEIEKRIEPIGKTNYWGSAGNTLASTFSRMKKEEAQNLMAAEDADAILDFVQKKNLNDENGLKSNYKFITECFSEFFSSERVMLADSLNLNILDLIKIGDKSANELWGEKYGHLERNMKQTCICAEILKCMLKGDEEVTHLSFKVENGEIKPGKTYLIMPTRAEAKKMHDSVMTIGLLKDDIGSKLVEYMTLLKTTHPENNKDANLSSPNRLGSQPYQNMCRALYRCYNLMLPANAAQFSIPKLRDALNDFQIAAEAYSKRGKTSNPDRMVAADHAAKRVGGFVKILDKFCETCKKDYYTADGDFIDAKLTQMQTMTQDRRRIVMLADEADRVIDQQKQRLYIDLNIAANEYEYNLKNMVGKLPDVKDATKKFTASDMARLYVFNQNVEAIKILEATDDNINYVKDKSENLDKTIFDDKVNAIKDNKVFQLVVKKYQAGAVKKWDEIIKKADRIVDEYENRLDNKTAAKHAEYVLSPKVNLSAKKDLKMNSKYDRLGEIVARQIIVYANNDNGTVAQAMAAGFIEYKDVVKACTDSLKNDKVLDKEGMNIDKLANQIKDREYMNSVMNKIAGSFRSSVEQKAKQQPAEHHAQANGPAM